MIGIVRRLLGAINRRANIVSDDPYYGWADTRLDELAEEARAAAEAEALERRLNGRGYTLKGSGSNVRKIGGQGLTEYVIILGIIAALVIGAAFWLGQNTASTLSAVGAALPGQAAPSAAPSRQPGDPCSPPKGGTWKLVPPDKWVCTK